MKVLVDTSVWSLFWRRGGPSDHPAVKKLAALLEAEEDVAISGVILQEILQAYRQPEARRRVDRLLDPVPLLPLTRSDCEAAAAIHRSCAEQGVAASTVDCQIAQAAVSHSHALLTADRDFERIAPLAGFTFA